MAAKAALHPWRFRYMGNSDDLRMVQRLARPAANGVSQTVGAAHLQKVAQDVLPLLTERVKQEEAREVSLRAANSPAYDPTGLLQPAQSVTIASGEELLRAGTVPAESASPESASAQSAAQAVPPLPATYRGGETKDQGAIPFQKNAS